MKPAVTLGALALIGASGCAAHPPRPSPRASAPAPTSVSTRPRYALVWTNAFVYTEASLSGPKARMKTYPDASRSSRPGDVWPVRVVREHDDVVEVTTLGVADAGHCVRGPALWNALSVRLHVRRGDLASALTRSIETSFSDGTRVVLNAGTPLAAGATSEETVAHVHGLSIRLPAASVTGGSFYEASPRFDLRSVKDETRDALFFRAGIELEKDPLASYPLLRHTIVDGKVNASVLTGCAQVEATSPSAVGLRPHHPVDAADAASSAAPKSAKHFPRGTPLSFEDGRDAGKTVDAMALSLLERIDTRLCFQRSLAEPEPGEPMPVEHSFDLCLPASAARENAQPRFDFRPRLKLPLGP